MFFRFTSPPVPVIQHFAALGAQLDGKYELHVEWAARFVSILSMISRDDGSILILVVIKVLVRATNIFARGQGASTYAPFREYLIICSMVNRLITLQETNGAPLKVSHTRG